MRVQFAGQDVITWCHLLSLEVGSVPIDEPGRGRVRGWGRAWVGLESELGRSRSPSRGRAGAGPTWKPRLAPVLVKILDASPEIKAKNLPINWRRRNWRSLAGRLRKAAACSSAGPAGAPSWGAVLILRSTLPGAAGSEIRASITGAAHRPTAS